LALLLAVAPGCTERNVGYVDDDRDPATADDAGVGDGTARADIVVYPVDAGPDEDGASRLDARGPRDLRAVDLRRPHPDLSPPDLAPPDAWWPDLPHVCDDLYGGAPGYVYCGETLWSCVFYSDSDERLTCSEICALGGGICLGGWDDHSDTCTPDEDAMGDCDEPHNDQICECARF
jgi:hypothetical protein